ncbi:type III pantothenate kinase [Mycoplasma iguanae]|uniref:Type III pantothenate kinase n=1 Tax=Mycoplasma iguanae TaxID=292461 RepID=A0ABY5RC68_9MOLU|nr:type III pantothenate kinase [Mycoplasma iguanae]UVD81805.1 type III pantothenate kinase [Mycoplasma iguanae]
MTTIYIDIGNSFLKIKNKDKNIFLKENNSLFLELDEKQKEHFFENLKVDEKESIKVFVSSVNEKMKNSVINFLEQKFQAEIFYLSFEKQNLIKIENYQADSEKKHEIGSDIIANAIAANSFYPQKKTLIVSLGTAIVYFVLYKQKIEGVAIDVGFNKSITTFFNSLWNDEKINALWLNYEADLLGLDTKNAISAGIINSKVMAIKGYIKLLKEQYQIEQVVFTGGDFSFLSKKITEMLHYSFDFEPEMVISGLEIWSKTFN